MVFRVACLFLSRLACPFSLSLFSVRQSGCVQGSFHTEQCMAYGSRFVGGVNPSKKGSTWKSSDGQFALPVFESVREVRFSICVYYGFPTVQQGVSGKPTQTVFLSKV